MYGTVCVCDGWGAWDVNKVHDVAAAATAARVLLKKASTARACANVREYAHKCRTATCLCNVLDIFSISV